MRPSVQSVICFILDIADLHGATGIKRSYSTHSPNDVELNIRYLSLMLTSAPGRIK